MAKQSKFEELRDKYHKLNSDEGFEEIGVDGCLVIYAECLKDIASKVKKPGNLGLILQEETFEIREMRNKHSAYIRALGILSMDAILNGVLENSPEVHEFAMEGDSGYADLRERMVRHVVDNERKGIDYKPEKERGL